MALAHCGCGQAQRSLGPLPSAASEQAWLQYFSPAETGQVQFGWAQRSWVASGMMGSWDSDWFHPFDARFGRRVRDARVEKSNRNLPLAGTRRGYSGSNHPDAHPSLTLKSEGSTIIKSAGEIGGKS